MTTSLRLAHLTPTHFSDASVVGGGERYVDNLVCALQADDRFNQAIVTLGPMASTQRRNGVAVRVLRNDALRPGAMEGVSAALPEVVRGYDLLHIHQCLTTFGAFCTAVARSAGVPAIGTDLGGGADPLMLQRGGIELLSGVVSISTYAQDLLGRSFGGPAEVLIGPVDTDAFAPEPAIQRDPRLVLCVGRILPHKGIDRIIAALPKGLSLVVVGRVYHEAYHALLLKMAAGRDVRFVHDADDAALIGFYRRAAVLVQASTTRDVFGNVIDKPELMGLTTLEAMACGLPAIVSDAGSLPELVPDPRFGRVFSDHAGLSALLAEVAAGTWPGPDAATLARDHVIAAHGMAAIGRRLGGFYQAVLATSRRGR